MFSASTFSPPFSYFLISFCLLDYFFAFFAPYLLRLWFIFTQPTVSSTPRTMWYRTPGKSFTRPPRIMTTECSCRLCPIPGIYAVTSCPLVKRTRATFRSAEFGFFGVVVNTFKHTPRLNGDVAFTGRFLMVLKYTPIAGDFDLTDLLFRPVLISCLIVGIFIPVCTRLANYLVSFLFASLK